jgi:hypothetical protein
MNTLYRIHKNFWTKKHLGSLFNGAVLAFVALIAQKLADMYVSNLQGVPVGDILLSNLPTFDIDFFIVEISLILTLVAIILLILKPKYFLFTLKAFSLFVIVRAFFISLTHLGVDPHQVVFNTDGISFWFYNLIYNTKGDFFFSGHTGLPFLMALIFWREKVWRNFFIIASGVLGVSVLLGHIHYSIDVFAAPFMTYGIYTITKKVFEKDYTLTQ